MATAIKLAADVVIRPQSGRWSVASASSGAPAFVCDSPQLLMWITQFVAPTDLDVALRAFTTADRPAVAHLVQQFLRTGLLQDENVGAQTSLDHYQKTTQLLSGLSRQVYDLTADIQSYGEYAELQFRARGDSVFQRVYDIGAQLHSLRQELSALRGPFVQAQARQLSIDAHTNKLRLHLGCGPVRLEGFVNIDIAPAPLSMNVLWGLPFEDGQAELAYLSHLLEHLFFPNDVNFVLAELFRVLEPDGLIRVVVPDIEACLLAYRDNDQAFFDARREHFSWWPADATTLENFLTYAGVGTEPNYLFESHKYGYDFATLEKALRNAGFTQIRRCHFQGSASPHLHVEHLSEAASWSAGERYLSLFVEARKP
jgi:SAM-dependent methyltransferase